MAHNSIWFILFCWNGYKRKKYSYGLYYVLSYVVEVFKASLELSRIKWLKLGLFATKNSILHYLAYIFVLKCLKSKSIVIFLIIRPKLCFWGFLSVFDTLSHKIFQIWFVCHEKLHTTIVVFLILRAKLRFWGFFAFLALSRIKWFKLGLFAMRNGTYHYLTYIIVLQWLELKK